MTITTEDFGTLAVCAIRYCQGRQTYMPSTVQGIVLEHIQDVDDRDLYVLIQDCEDQVEYGSELIDKPGWLAYREKLEEEWKRRKPDESDCKDGGAGTV